MERVFIRHRDAGADLPFPVGIQVSCEFQSMCGAVFSPCRLYRYALWRRWEDCPLARMVAFIGLNPSTADETVNDPTVTRCIRFAKDWGFGGMVMLNAFSFRATDPEVMKAIREPVGELNDDYLLGFTGGCGRSVACWGVHCVHRFREDELKRLFSNSNLHVFGLTKEGHPKHPLYLRSDCVTSLWKAGE